MLMPQTHLDLRVPGDQIFQALQVFQVTLVVFCEVARLHGMSPTPAGGACIAGQQHRPMRGSDQICGAARCMSRHADGKYRAVFKNIDDALKLVLRVRLKMPFSVMPEARPGVFIQAQMPNLGNGKK